MNEVADVLLVGSGEGSVGKLSAALGRLYPDWSFRQISDVTAAPEHVQLRPVDLVLACLDGDPEPYQQLFDQIAQASARTIRFALLDEQHLQPPRISGAHQVLSLRENVEFLKPVLAAAVEVSRRTQAHHKLEKIICNLQDVPSPPTLYFDIREALENPSNDLANLAEITARDASLVARVLKITNSGFYGIPRTVSDLAEAIGLIGMDSLLGLVLAAHLYSGLPPPGLKLELLWQHTTRVSLLARQITSAEGGNRHAQSQSAVAGLLHDIGLMVLLENEPARYQPLWKQSQGNEVVLADMERDAFGATHGELGALILMLWSLPREVVDAVANSHAPAEVFNKAGNELELTSQSVLAAEWLLDSGGNPQLDEPPVSLANVPEEKLRCWQALRDELTVEIMAL